MASERLQYGTTPVPYKIKTLTDLHHHSYFPTGYNSNMIEEYKYIQSNHNTSLHSER